MEDKTLAEKYADKISKEIQARDEDAIFGLNDEGEPLDAYDYLEDVLDIRYIVDSQKRYLGAELMLTVGGPTTWLDTRDGELTVSWGSSRVTRYLPGGFVDYLNYALEEIWESN